MSLMKTTLALLFSVVTLLGLQACEEGPLEDAGESIDEGIEDTGDALDDAADDVDNEF